MEKITVRKGYSIAERYPQSLLRSTVTNTKIKKDNRKANNFKYHNNLKSWQESGHAYSKTEMILKIAVEKAKVSILVPIGRHVGASARVPTDQWTENLITEHFQLPAFLTRIDCNAIFPYVDSQQKQCCSNKIKTTSRNHTIKLARIQVNMLRHEFELTFLIYPQIKKLRHFQVAQARRYCYTVSNKDSQTLQEAKFFVKCKSCQRCKYE